MRLFFVLALPAALSGACTPFIPIKDAFSTSAVKPTGNIPPEFAEFNRYDSQVNAIVTDQMCATPYILDTEKSLRATPGEFNRYDPQVNGVVSDQMCATPFILDTEKSLRATPGEFVSWSGRCEQYEIRLDNLAEHFTP